MLAGIHEARAKVLTPVEALVEAHPLHPALTSMPAVGVRTAARILTDVVGKNFPTAGHLASYAGLSPVTWRSGSSIRGDHASRRGNKALKRVLFLSAFASLRVRPAGPTTTGNETKANALIRPSWHWPADAATPCTPCFATEPSTKPAAPLRLDEKQRKSARRFYRRKLGCPGS